jgi:hypothetical protein
VQANGCNAAVLEPVKRSTAADVHANVARAAVPVAVNFSAPDAAAPKDASAASPEPTLLADAPTDAHAKGCNAALAVPVKRSTAADVAPKADRAALDVPVNFSTPEALAANG